MYGKRQRRPVDLVTNRMCVACRSACRGTRRSPRTKSHGSARLNEVRRSTADGWNFTTGRAPMSGCTEWRTRTGCSAEAFSVSRELRWGAGSSRRSSALQSTRAIYKRCRDTHSRALAHDGSSALADCCLETTRGSAAAAGESAPLRLSFVHAARRRLSPCSWACRIRWWAAWRVALRTTRGGAARSTPMTSKAMSASMTVSRRGFPASA